MDPAELTLEKHVSRSFLRQQESIRARDERKLKLREVELRRQTLAYFLWDINVCLTYYESRKNGRGMLLPECLMCRGRKNGCGSYVSAAEELSFQL